MLRKICYFNYLGINNFNNFCKKPYKKLDEEIFLIKENINYLNSVYALVQLEFDYLSSPEKLLELIISYFSIINLNILQEKI